MKTFKRNLKANEHPVPGKVHEPIWSSRANSVLRADDLRRDYKIRRKRQIEFVQAHPDMDLDELARLAVDQKIYAPSANLETIANYLMGERARISAPNARERIYGRDPETRRIAEAALQELHAPLDLNAIRHKQREAYRAIAGYLKFCSWEQSHLRHSGMSFWKDPLSGATHRIDIAFVVAVSRASEIERLALLPKSQCLSEKPTHQRS